MEDQRFRVGLRVPLRFSATWPLVGLQVDDEGIWFRGPFLRYFVSRAIGMTHAWGDIATVGDAGRRVTFTLRDRRRVAVVGLTRGRRARVVAAARAGGVRVL
ncbi:hypothetical protein [Cellulomonas septica]|uniref:Uncharacterized protein n=1 Tax=Cellulomonas septica TaxID=285080 RepID=A0ABX1K0X5_9CELL|nr:hypothetical protein [Cellulomonas septica]NKY39645.1 hypothetical protein [Cellulomonas septica]